MPTAFDILNRIQKQIAFTIFTGMAIETVIFEDRQHVTIEVDLPNSKRRRNNEGRKNAKMPNDQRSTTRKE